MPSRSRSRGRFTAVGALGVVAALGLALAPAPETTVTSSDAVAFAPQLVTVDTPTQADKDRLLALGLDLTEHAGPTYVEVILHSAAEEATLRDAGFTWDVRIADLLARELERLAADRAYADAVDVSSLPSGRTTYRTLADFGAEIDALEAAHPEIAKRISIGTSVEGRDLTGIEIGEGVNDPEDGRPVLLLFGTHHAREWPSAEVPMEFAHDLVQGYTDETHPDHARIVDLLSRGRAVIVPVSNPDGYDASRTSGDAVDLREVDNGGTVSILGTPGNAYKRKNCRYADGQTQPAGTCVLVASPGGIGVGIDLNRNYGALWGGPGASADRSSATYHGPAPFSEPETQAIRTLISSRQVTTLITNHTFGNLILRPVGVNPAIVGPDGNPVGFAPDECFTAADGHDMGMQALGERMAAQNGYSNQFGWELYDTTGTTEDYSYNATGGYGYTFEIGPTEFHPPFEEVVAEYVGDTSAAKGVTPENAGENTTAAADECSGIGPDHTDVGGGLREAFLVAFENAVDARTHSLITGQAPAGATLTLTRSGIFPLWDGAPFADTVATTMVTDADGAFTWHVNPSTRPFVQSRKAPILGPRKDRLRETAVAPATLHSYRSDHPFVVEEDADILTATVQAAASASGLAVNFAEYHLRLLDPNGVEVASATEFGAVNTLAWTGVDGQGVPAGTYTLRVTNAVNPTAVYSIEAYTQDILGQRTARAFETWTLSCLTADGLAGQASVQVERGQSVDVGQICAA